MRLLSLLCLLVLPACFFQNISTATKLRESIEGAADESRWGRLDLSVQRVHPAYRSAYMASHHDWGRGIQIADSEVLDVQLDDGEDEATSTIAVAWYSYETMTLERSLVRQRWERASGGFYLRDEEVVDGSDRLLEPPPQEEDDGEDSEEEPDRVAAATP